VDIIHLQNIRIYGYTGYLEEERTLGQWFEVDAKISVDLSLAGRSDRIEDTLDYRGIIADFRKIVGTAKFALIERLADALAEAVMKYDRATRVRIRLTKLAPPIPEFGGQITVEIDRNKRADS
jgi:7,8-dihydroneopterin aldolase/epimerase/oxygenase